MRKPPVEAILDANAILALAKGEVLHHLPRLFETVIYPPEVGREIKDPRSRQAFEEAREQWLRSVKPSQEILATVPLRFEEDLADRAVIALSLERPDALVLSGDREIVGFLRSEARDTALPENTVVALKRAGLIPLGGPVLERMLSRGYYISSQRLRDLLEALGEAPQGPS